MSEQTGPIEPTPEQMMELGKIAGSGEDGPIVMLNLNRYRDQDAYMRYGEVAVRVLERVGGRILWHTQALGTSVGDSSDVWDEVIAVWYPSAAAFVAFGTDPEAVAAFEHRRAGLERAAIIRCAPGTTDFPA